MTDYVIVDRTNVHWPGLGRYRSAESQVGYPTREAAEARIRVLTARYAARYGAQGGPDLRVVKREK